MPRAKRWIGVAAVNLLTLLALTIGAEVVARKLCHQEFEALFPRRDLAFRAGPFVEGHPVRGLALVPGYDDGFHRVNAAGFRGPELPEDLSRRFLIVALGESTTFGWGVAEGEDYPRRLQAILEEQGYEAVHVVNAGVPAFTSTQTLLYLREVLAGGLEPDLVLVSALWNDIWFSTVLGWQPHLLVHRPPPLWRRWLLESSGLYRCVLLSRVAESGLVDVFNEEAFERYLANFEEIFELARRHDLPLVLVDPPFDSSHMPAQGLNRFHVTLTRDFFVATAGKHLAALAELAERYDVASAHHRLSIEDLDQGDLFLDPLHPNAEGNDLMARDVATFLIEHDMIDRP